MCYIHSVDARTLFTHRRGQCHQTSTFSQCQFFWFCFLFHGKEQTTTSIVDELTLKFTLKTVLLLLRTCEHSLQLYT